MYQYCQSIENSFPRRLKKTLICLSVKSIISNIIPAIKHQSTSQKSYALQVRNRLTAVTHWHLPSGHRQQRPDTMNTSDTMNMPDTMNTSEKINNILSRGNRFCINLNISLPLFLQIFLQTALLLQLLKFGDHVKKRFIGWKRTIVSKSGITKGKLQRTPRKTETSPAILGYSGKTWASV